MKKWFEFMASFQDPEKDHDFDNYQFKNLHRETECLRKLVESGRYTKTEHLAFDPSWYANKIDYKYLDNSITPEQVREWINDPEFHRLIHQSGTSVTIEIPSFVRQEFVKQARPHFDLDWDRTEVKLMVQEPGQMFPLHYDRFRSREFDMDKSREQELQRWVIMLYDQQPGQCFFLGNQSIAWKSGDVVDWEGQTNLPHGSANFGYWPRYSVRITGPILQNQSSEDLK